MEPVIKEPATTQEIQIQSYTQMHWETTLEKSSSKFLKKINQASSGSTLKQTDLPFTKGNKMLFLLTGSISWMQGSYIIYFISRLLMHGARSKCENLTLKMPTGNLYQ